jgi:hypothetical protein
MKVAELLFKNGFKEAYAIKGGVRGQQGWMVCPFSSVLLCLLFFTIECIEYPSAFYSYIS